MITNRLHPLRNLHRGLGHGVRPRRIPCVLALVLVLSIVGGVEDTYAFRGWCRADPQFQIGDQLVLVTVSAQTDDLKTARALSTGPIVIVVNVPPGVQAKYLAGSNGFGQGFDVTIEHAHGFKDTDTGIPVKITTYVPMSDSTVAIQTDFLPAGAAAQALIDPGRGQSGDRGRNNGVLVPNGASGSANEWIEMSS